MKRVLSVQDISCLGQCSMTVALPILSVCGLETCILPTMVLSTHTGGLSTPHCRDLTADIEPIAAHWQSRRLDFDGICVGYLGRAEQARLVGEAASKLLKPGGRLMVDPAMADHGRLYSGITADCVAEMKALCARADVLLPNVTEGYLLADLPYEESPGEGEIEKLLEALVERYQATVLLTGVGLRPGETGFALREQGRTAIYSRPREGGSYHGTGDMFTAVFAGAHLQGRSAWEAGVLAAEFVARVAQATAQAPAHDYGTRFEAVLPWLARQMEA